MSVPDHTGTAEEVVRVLAEARNEHQRAASGARPFLHNVETHQYAALRSAGYLREPAE